MSANDADDTRTARPAITPDVVQALRDQGMNQSAIAKAFGVSRQAVSQVVIKGGIEEVTPRQRAMRHWPWKVSTEMGRQHVFNMLRAHAEFVDSGDSRMSFTTLTNLLKFYQRLESNSLVVEFDPSLPPSEGISKGGFAYRKRLDSDQGLIIRLNAHTALTDEGLKVWAMPKVMPDPGKGLINRGKGLVPG